MQKSLFSLFLILAATLSMLGCGSSSSNSELRSIDEYVNVIKMYLDQRYHFKNEEALASGIYLNYSGGLSENLFEENISSKSALHNSIKKSFSDLIRNKILTNSQVDIIANKISDVYEMTNYTITSLGETKKFKENDDEYHAVHVTLKYPDIKKIIDQVTNNVKEEYNITTEGSLSEGLSSPFYGIDKINKKQFGESILNNYIKFSDKENISFKDIEYTVYIKKDKERNAYFIANNKIEGNKSIVDFLTRFNILSDTFFSIGVSNPNFINGKSKVLGLCYAIVKDSVIDLGDKGKFNGLDFDGISVGIYDVKDETVELQPVRDLTFYGRQWITFYSAHHEITVSYIIKNNNSIENEIDLNALNSIYNEYNEEIYLVDHTAHVDIISNIKRCMKSEPNKYYSYNAKLSDTDKALILNPNEIVILPIKYQTEDYTIKKLDDNHKEVKIDKEFSIEKIPKPPYHIFKYNSLPLKNINIPESSEIPTEIKANAKGSKNDKTSTNKSNLSLGGLKLGDSVEQMHKVLGVENRTSSSKTPGHKHYEYKDIVVTIKDDTFIDGLVSYTDKVQTEKEIRQGSTLEEVLSNYGRKCVLSEHDGATLYEYISETNNGKGTVLRFAIKNNIVDYISLRFVDSEEKSRLMSRIKSL